LTNTKQMIDLIYQHKRMKGTNLGELEELVLLIVGVLFDEAYGVAIQNELQERCDRKATLSTIHVALHRLEEKGFLESRFDGATNERGGRRKLLFRVTKSGQRTLANARDMRNELWKGIPKAAFSFSI
jgi:PadR family transcriptional regulator PadR